MNTPGSFEEFEADLIHHRTIERQALELQAAAWQNQLQAQRTRQHARAKKWWIVERSLAEAIYALKELRGAPGLKPNPYGIQHPNLDPEGLDHMGIPSKENNVTG